MAKVRFRVEFECDECHQVSEKMVSHSFIRRRSDSRRPDYIATYSPFKVYPKDWKDPVTWRDLCYPCLEKMYPAKPPKETAATVSP